MTDAFHSQGSDAASTPCERTLGTPVPENCSGSADETVNRVIRRWNAGLNTDDIAHELDIREACVDRIVRAYFDIRHKRGWGAKQ